MISSSLLCIGIRMSWIKFIVQKTLFIYLKGEYSSRISDKLSHIDIGWFDLN